MTSDDLARIRDAVQLRDRCVAAAVKHYQWVQITPSGQHARAAFDAMEPLIAERVRAKVAEEIAQAIEAEHWGGPETRDALEEAVRITRRHAGSTQGPEPEVATGA